MRKYLFLLTLVLAFGFCLNATAALGWNVLPNDPSYFPYGDYTGTPPSYQPVSNLSTVVGSYYDFGEMAWRTGIYTVGGYADADVVDDDGKTYYANRQSHFSIYTIETNSWVSAKHDGTGPTGYNNGNGTALPTVDQGTYTGNNQAFAYDIDSDGVDEVYVLAGYPRWGGGFDVYDPDTDAWSTTSDRPEHSGGGYKATYRGLALVKGTTAYIYGGGFSGPDDRTLWHYDIPTDTWTERTSSPTGKSGHCGEIVGNIMYAISGGSSNTVQRYDTSTETWLSDGAPIPVAVDRAASVKWHDRIYVVGGRGVNGYEQPLVQEYNPATDTWRIIGGLTLPAGRSRQGAVIVGDTLYVVDGMGSGAQSDLWSHTMVPEPSTLMLFGTGLLSLLVLLRRKRK